MLRSLTRKRTGPLRAAGALVLTAALSSIPLLAEPQVTNIGIVVDGPAVQYGMVSERVQREIGALTQSEFDVRFPEAAHLVGDWTLAQAKIHLDQLVRDPEVDLVIAWGLLASQAACCLEGLSKPIIASAVVDVDIQGFPFDRGTSGEPNLSYIVHPYSLREELEVLRGIVPFRHLAVLGNAELLGAIQGLPESLVAEAAVADVQLELVPVGLSARDALAAIPETADAAYLWPLNHLQPREFDRLVSGLHDRGLPSFSAGGRADIDAGILASTGSDELLIRLTRRVALNVQRILLGEDAGSIPVEFSVPRQLKINMATARRIDVSPTWESLIESELVNVNAADLPPRSFVGTIEEALRANLDLAAQRRVVAAGEQEVAKSKSVFFPQIEISTLGVAIDEDRARASFGSQAERTFSAAASLSQVVYSEAATANLAIQRRLQEARGHELESLRLDTALEAAVAYLNLMRAKTFVRVQRNNLQRTRSNLSVAENRRLVGEANSAEVFRWQSQIAIDREALVAAIASERAAEVAVNRLVNRDLEERFATVEVGMDDASFIAGQSRLQQFVGTPMHFEIFCDFLVQEGLAAAPELRQLESAMQAKMRALRSEKLAFWVPTISAQASLEELIAEGGLGADLAPPLPEFGVPRIDDTNWSIGFKVSLPLFTGGSRKAEVVQSEEELKGLRLEHAALVEKLGQQIRSGLLFVRASSLAIRLTQQASDAAQKNLGLVADAYARGAVSILSLLDAQAAALNAQEKAASSVYDFLLDLMEVERATSRFDFLLTTDERDAWFVRLEQFFQERGVSLP